MKKIYTIIMVVLINNLITYAQPVLNSSDFNVTFNMYRYPTNDNISGLSAGAAGANVTWDFSAMTATLDGTYSSVSVASTPYAADFPTANFAYKFSSPGDPDEYSYYKVTSTQFELLGSKDVDYTDLLIDTSIIFNFPFTYLTSFSDSYANASDPPGGYTNSVSYDGYGTLITPYETFTNVVRRKSVEIDGNVTFTDYEWYTTNPCKIVMAMGFYDNPTDNQFGNYTEFLTSSNLSITENEKTNVVSIYPNPTNSILNLDLSNEIAVDKIVIIDITGKIVLQQNQNLAQINLEKLEKGLYIIEVYSQNNKFTSKFIKE